MEINQTKCYYSRCLLHTTNHGVYCYCLLTDKAETKETKGEHLNFGNHCRPAARICLPQTRPQKNAPRLLRVVFLSFSSQNSIWLYFLFCLFVICILEFCPLGYLRINFYSVLLCLEHSPLHFRSPIIFSSFVRYTAAKETT